MKILKFEQFNEMANTPNHNRLSTNTYNDCSVYVLDGNDETGYVLMLIAGQSRNTAKLVQAKIKNGEDVSEWSQYLIYTKPGEWSNKRTASLRTCDWYGENAYIIGGSKSDGYVLLVGNYTEQEARQIKKLVDSDAPESDEYNIVFADPEEWKEQNMF